MSKAPVLAPIIRHAAEGDVRPSSMFDRGTGSKPYVDIFSRQGEPTADEGHPQSPLFPQGQLPNFAIRLSFVIHARVETASSSSAPPLPSSPPVGG